MAVTKSIQLIKNRVYEVLENITKMAVVKIEKKQKNSYAKACCISSKSIRLQHLWLEGMFVERHSTVTVESKNLVLIDG